MRKITAFISAVLLSVTLTACNSKPMTASRNSETGSSEMNGSADIISDSEQDINSSYISAEPAEVSDSSYIETVSEEEPKAETESKKSDADEDSNLNGKTPAASPPPKTESVQSTPSEKPTQNPTSSVPEETEESKPSEEEPAEPQQPVESIQQPEFDIQTWIDYAGNYAVSVGLLLDSQAVECWDNPISAGPQCRYLERDIQSRINRYRRDGDITAVWIWAEKRSDGNYDIFIGYA